ncbi:MAG: extracellular solute-binding protein [Clostridia bacterium]|nr:extracellular solute-binding protein [Clostridia bacterium]
MNKLFKKIICATMAASLTAFCAGCSGKTTSDGGDIADGEVSGKLKVWGINPICITGYEQVLEVDPTNSNGLYTKWLMESFKEKYPNVTVSVETAGWELELNKNIMTAIGAHTQPDALATATYTPILSRYGHLAILNIDEEIESDLITALDDFCIHQGKRYAVPVVNGCIQLCVNKAVLRKAGIIDAEGNVVAEYEKFHPLAPETMEDMLEVSKVIKAWAKKQSGDAAKTGGFLMCTTNADSHIRALMFMAAAGGDFADNYGNVYLNSPENIKAYEYCRELYKYTTDGADGANTQADLNSLFYNGLAAYFITDPEIVYPIARSGGYAGFNEEDLGWMSVPVFEGVGIKASVDVGCILFAVMQQGKNTAAAKAFVNHLLSYEAQKKEFEIIGRTPVRKSVLRDIKEENSDWYQKNKNSIDAFLDETVTVNKGIPTLENNSSLCWDAWNAMWKDVCWTDKDIPTLVKNCAQKWTNYLAEED